MDNRNTIDYCYEKEKIVTEIDRPSESTYTQQIEFNKETDDYNNRMINETNGQGCYVIKGYPSENESVEVTTLYVGKTNTQGDNNIGKRALESIKERKINIENVTEIIIYKFQNDAKGLWSRDIMEILLVAENKPKRNKQFRYFKPEDAYEEEYWDQVMKSLGYAEND